MIRLIAAIDNKRGLAKDNRIPWKLPKDSQRFRSLTLTHGGKVLVGRATYEQMASYLKDHQAYVVSHQELDLLRGQMLVKDIDTFLKDLKEDLWVIGGAGIYEASIKYADELYLTVIDADFNCDRFFPEYSDFKVKQSEGPIIDNGLTTTYQVLTRL